MVFGMVSRYEWCSRTILMSLYALGFCITNCFSGLLRQDLRGVSSTISFSLLLVFGLCEGGLSLHLVYPWGIGFDGQSFGVACANSLLGVIDARIVMYFKNCSAC